MQTQDNKTKKSDRISEFLKFIQECDNEYNVAYEEVGKEDRKTVDLLHDMEFAPNQAERNKIATKLHNVRIQRRKGKDTVQENEEIVQFYKKYKKVFDEMKEMLGRQRKKETYLNSDRIYKPREAEQLTEPLKEKILKVIGNP